MSLFTCRYFPDLLSSTLHLKAKSRQIFPENWIWDAAPLDISVLRLQKKASSSKEGGWADSLPHFSKGLASAQKMIGLFNSPHSSTIIKCINIQLKWLTECFPEPSLDFMNFFWWEIFAFLLGDFYFFWWEIYLLSKADSPEFPNSLRPPSSILR